MFLFGIPFWAGGFCVAGIIANQIFGVEHLRITRGSIERWRRIAGCRFGYRTVPVREVRTIESYSTSYEIDGRHLSGLQIRTVGKPIIFGVGVSEEECDWLMEMLRQRLRDAKSKYPPEIEATQVATDDIQSLPLSAEAQAPSDSDWELQQLPQGSQFLRRGKLSFLHLAGATFVNLFWNSIVGIFVLTLIGLTGEHPPTGGQWWALFFFLIPFEVVGVGVFAVWLAWLTMPAWRERLILERHEITWQFHVFGLGRTKRLNMVELGAVTVRRRKPSQGFLEWNNGEWEVLLANQVSVEVLRMKSLTEGEAQWIAASLKHTYPRSFGSNVR